MELLAAGRPAICVPKMSTAVVVIPGTARIPGGAKIKPYGFTLFAKRYGMEVLLDCLEENEKNGVVYHRRGIMGDYDDFGDVETLIQFIKTGKRST